MKHTIVQNLFTTAPVTKQRESPLAVAVCEGSLDVIKYLVKECNANVNGESSVVVHRFSSCYPNTDV